MEISALVVTFAMLRRLINYRIIVIIIIIRPRRSRSAAAYSDQTFPLTICR